MRNDGIYVILEYTTGQRARAQNPQEIFRHWK